MNKQDTVTILAEPIHSGLHIHVYDTDVDAIQNAISLSASMHRVNREMVLQGGEDLLMEHIKSEREDHIGLYMRDLLLKSQGE